MVATPRHVRALADYLPVASADVYAGLGGADALDWAHKAIEGLGSEETVPVVGEDEILVLGLPYGGPNGGKDSDNQFFSQMTDFMDGVNDTPPVMYTHGTQNGFEPEPVGKVTGRWYDRRGGWFKVKLDKANPRYEQLRSAHSGGHLKASSGVVPASFSFNPGTGHIDTWLVGELSLVDTRDGYRPVNGYAVTKATADTTLFTDYYGDGVMANDAGSISNLVTQFINAIRQHFKDHEALVEGVEKIEDAVEGGDVGDMGNTKLGFQDQLYKATAADDIKCRPDMNEDQANDITYLKTEEETNPLDPTTESTEEKCLPCEEAKRKGDLLKAELAAPATVAKCSRCPEAIDWIRGMVKAAKVAPLEAFQLIDRFSESDDGFDEFKATIEARTSLGISKARQDGLNLTLVQPNVGIDPETLVDPEHMNKQRRLAGLPTK